MLKKVLAVAGLGKMNRISLALVSVAFAAAVATAPASAADYKWTFTSAGQDVHGTLTTDSAPNVAGNVTGIGGSVNGDIITGLVANPTPGAASQSNDTLFTFDNTLQPTSSELLTNPGLLFTTQSGTEYNLYSFNISLFAFSDGSTPSGPSGYNLDAGKGGEYGDSINGLFSIALASTAPEPSDWVLMLIGFIGLGAMVRLARKPVTSAA